LGKSWIDRQNRLNQILGLLKSDGSWTTESLASCLHVSCRTLVRDIALLREQGYPIESSRGKGGGVALRGRYGIGKLLLSDEEVIHAIVAFAIAEKVQSPLLTQSMESLRNKFALFLGDKQQARVNSVRNRILIGDNSSEQVLASYTPNHMPIPSSVTQSFFNLELLDIEYVSETKTQSCRIIEPQYLLLNWPVWYVLAWDVAKNAVRMFRVDRIITAQIVAATFRERPKYQMLDGLEEYFDRI
jgi:predicted DNA-binding transcriptional regulator YafY